MPFITLTLFNNGKRDVVINIDHIVAFQQNESGGSEIVTTAINGNPGAMLFDVVEEISTVMTLIEDAELKRSRK